MDDLRKELEIQLLASEGVITPEIEELLDKVMKSDHVDRTLLWLISKHEVALSLIETRKHKKDLIETKLKSAQNSLLYWKNKIDLVLKDNKLKSISIDEYDLSYTKSESVEIFDENLIPKEYLKETTTVSPDKVKIKNAIKQDIVVPGAILKENNNLQIK
ncbi:MAG TPA: siphovirus Gp157 family protein [Candidatus Absconditabacterales bacterium]|nr:siphovirus Gp157 family protein [Candidatus Absconditabacterales bacterium]